MNDAEQQPKSVNVDPNFKPVYKGGSQPTLVEKNAVKPPEKEDVFDDSGRVLFGE